MIMALLSAVIQPVESVLQRNWALSTCSSWEMHLLELEYGRMKTGQIEEAQGTEEKMKSGEFISKSSGRSWGLWLVQILRTRGLRDSSVR